MERETTLKLLEGRGGILAFKIKDMTNIFVKQIKKTILAAGFLEESMLWK